MKKIIGIMAIALAFALAFAACDNGADTDGADPGGIPGIGGTYFFESEDGDIYVLVVSDDGDYVLTVIGAGTSTEKTSTGTAEKSGGVYTLTPSSPEADPFTVTVDTSGVTGMGGTITFDDGTSEEAPTEITVAPPENVDAKYRWSIWRDPSSTATLVNFSVDNDGKVTITTGGKAEPQGVNNKWQAWKITAEYAYTSKANTAYKYVIEASKQGPGERRMNVQYYEDNAAAIYLGGGFTLTDTPTEYTIYGQKLPKQGEPIRFQCADYTGTFYLKIISIEEYVAGELTITNFRGTPSLLSDKWSTGWADFSANDDQKVMFIQHDDGFEVPASGSSITINVYNARVESVLENGWKFLERTTPFDGNGTAAAESLWICQWGENDYEAFYTNKVPITFTNGKADINFGTQMVKSEDFKWDEKDRPTEPTLPGTGGYSLNGTWLEESGTIMIIEGNTITITNDEGELFGSGTFTIDGNSIEVTFTEGEEEQIGTFTGIFYLSDNGNTLTMAIGGEDTVWLRQ
jgi:hypothetical protein